MLKSGEKLHKLLILLVTWGLLFAFFIAYERYFVNGQREFLKESGFRALATLSGELSAQVQKARASTESFIKLAAPDRKEKTLTPETLKNFLQLYLGDTPISPEALNGMKKCSRSSPENPEQPPIEITPGRDTLTLSISCYARKDEHDHNSKSEPKIHLYTVDLVKGIKDAFEKQSGSFDDVLVADSSGHVIFQYSVPIANAQFSTKPRITNLTSLLPSSAPAEPKTQDHESADKKKDLRKGSKRESAASSGKQETEDKTANNTGSDQPDDSGSSRDDQHGAEVSPWIRRLIGASAFTEVTTAGKRYEMFSRPFRYRLPSGETWDLVVCALSDSEQFEKDSRAIPYSTLIWAALIIVALLSLSWPLFKLRYMSNTERFTATDGWYLVLALFLASTSATLMLLNASYIAREQNNSDRGMEKLTGLIKAHFADEMERAVQQLGKFPGYPSWKETSTKPLQWEFLKLHDRDNSDEFPYPYFNSVAWADKDGQQLFKFDIRSAPTPNIKIDSRSYFKRAISDGSPCAPNLKSPDHYHYLEPILSANTDEFSTELAGLFPTCDEKGIAVEALNTRPMSLVDPVLPPGYRFAVIDTDCNVLFHSDSFRNMREDFCEQFKGKDKLEPWLKSGNDTPLDISYEGETERAYLSSLSSLGNLSSLKSPLFAETQALLLVFREPARDLTLNLAVVLVCSVLMGAYFVVLLVLPSAAYFLLRKLLGWVYMPPFLWPRRERAVAYLQILAANVLILLLFWSFYPQLYEGPLLALTVAVAAVSVLLALSKLAFPRWGPLVLGALLAATILVSWLALPLRAPNEPLDWEFVWCLLGASGLIAVLLADKVSTWIASTRIAAILTATASSWVKRTTDWLTRISPHFLSGRIARFSDTLNLPRQVKYFAEKHFGVAYVLAVLSVITAAGLVPCIGCFKYSYDAVTELALKHDEMVVAEQVIRRQDNIRETYKDVQSIAERRMKEKWDRYDSDIPLPRPGDSKEDEGFFRQPFFNATIGDSTPAGDACKGFPPGARDTINEGIERWIARATLIFPTNRLGAQMSKLGVASTNDVENSWGYSWSEPEATCFQFHWETPSRWSPLTVTSRYPDWKGLLWPQRFLLVILWLVLGFWLLMVLKKIFLVGLEDLVPFETVRWTKVAEIEGNFLVIDRAESGRELWKDIADLSPRSRLDLRDELKKMIEDKSYRPTCEEPVLILDHFDFNMKDGNYNQARLNLLEILLCELDLRLVIISTLDPLYFLTDDAAEALANGNDSALTRRLLDRWASALSKFKKVHPEDLSQEEFETVLQPFTKSGDFAIWIKQECDHTSKLREIGEKVLKEVPENNSLTCEWVVSRVSALADSYYHVLWAGLSTTERLVLYQLARDGWANPKNLVAIQQLESKHLVCRKPMYQISNESFRRFVVSAEHADEIAQWEGHEQQSTWHAVRFVVIVVGIGLAGWLLYTQAAFSNALVGYIAAIATLLTAVGSFAGRSGRPRPTNTEGA